PRSASRAARRPPRRPRAPAPRRSPGHGGPYRTVTVHLVHALPCSPPPCAPLVACQGISPRPRLPGSDRFKQILGAGTPVEQRAHVLLRAALGLHHGYPDEGLPPDVEDDRVPA